MVSFWRIFINTYGRKDMKHLLLLTLLFTGLVACNEDKSQTRTSLTAGAEGCSGSLTNSSETGPLFEVNGNMISREDLPGGLKEALYESEYESYSKNQTIFEELALRIYLAKKQDKLKDPKNPPSLLELLSIPEPTDAEMKVLFEQSKTRLPPGTKFEGPIKAQISQYIKGQKVGTQFQIEVDEMKKAGAYKLMIAAPIAPELKLDLKGFPTLGKKDSKVHVVEVSDYTCGHCQRAHSAVKDIIKKYADRISFTQVNFALRPEGESGLYIQGAFCAEKESLDKFWVYHNEAFNKTSEPHDHGAHGHAGHDSGEAKKKVMMVAKAAKLDMVKFEKCLESAEAKKYVTTTATSLSEQGINGTPVFLINNTKIGGGVRDLEEEIKKRL